MTNDTRDDDATCTRCVRRKYDKLTVRKNPRMTVVVKRWKNATRVYSAVVRVQGAQKLWSVDFS